MKYLIQKTLEMKSFGILKMVAEEAKLGSIENIIHCSIIPNQIHQLLIGKRQVSNEILMKEHLADISKTTKMEEDIRKYAQTTKYINIILMIRRMPTMYGI